MKIYLAVYMVWVRLWFRLRFHYLCWRYGADHMLRVMERNLMNMGATVVVDTPERRVYKLGGGGTVEIVTVVEEEDEQAS